MVDIKQKNKDRLDFLKKIYEISNGQTAYTVDGWEQVGKILGFDRQNSTTIYHFLNDEGLTEPMGAGIRLSLTHDGLKEIEKAINEPDKPTEHFAPINQYNTINIGTMKGGAIQQSTNHSVINYIASSDTVNSINKFVDELTRFLKENEIESDLKNELAADISTIKEQIKSPKPKSNILKASIQSIKTVMEGAIGGVIGTLATPEAQQLIIKATEIINHTPT